MDMRQITRNAMHSLVIAFCLTFIMFTAQAKSPITIVVFGDSLSAGYGLEKQYTFPTRLNSALDEKGYSVGVVNAGVSGDTTAGGRARLDWTLGTNVDAVILELGANDALRGLGTEQAYRNLADILKVLADRGIPTLLAGMHAPPNMGEDYGKSFDDIFKRLNDEFDVIFYPFFLDGVAANPALNQKDGIHPNPAGVDVLVERILPDVEALLKRIGNAS